MRFQQPIDPRSASPGAPGLSGRHPEDPEPVANTKVIAAYVLAVTGLVLSPFVGGAIPAIFALVLAKQAERDIRDSEGWLLGACKLRRIRRLAGIALGIAAAVVTVAILLGVIGLAVGAGMPQIDGDTV